MSHGKGGRRCTLSDNTSYTRRNKNWTPGGAEQPKQQKNMKSPQSCVSCHSCKRRCAWIERLALYRVTIASCLNTSFRVILKIDSIHFAKYVLPVVL